MKTISAAALCLATLLAPSVAAPAGADAGEVRFQYAMSVGAGGNVIGLTPSGELPAEIDQWIREQVGRYTFAPATLNQQPQSATTTLYVTLGPVVSADGKPGYRLNSVVTGPKLLRGRYRSFPREEGAGYFDITFDATGRVTEVEVDDTQPFVGGRTFRKWAVGLAKSFRLQPETVAGRAVPGSGRLPIKVCMATCPELPHARDGDGGDLGGKLLAKSILVPVAPAGS